MENQPQAQSQDLDEQYLKIKQRLLRIRALLLDASNILRAYQRLSKTQTMLTRLQTKCGDRSAEAAALLCPSKEMDIVESELDATLWSILQQSLDLSMTNSTLLKSAITVLTRQITTANDRPTLLEQAKARFSLIAKARFEIQCPVESVSLLTSQSSRNLFVDLKRLVDIVQPLFSSTGISILELYSNAYHDGLKHRFLYFGNTINDKESMSALETLQTWLRVSYEPKIIGLGLTLQTNLLDATLDELRTKYIEYVFDALTSATNVILTTRYELNCIDNVSRTVMPTILFSLIDTYVKHATIVNLQSKIVIEVAKVLVSFCRRMSCLLIEEEVNIEYLIAMLNDFEQCWENSEFFDQSSIGLCVQDEFVNTMIAIRQRMTDICFNDLQPNLSDIDAITTTLYHYFTHEGAVLMLAHCRKWKIACLDRLVNIYQKDASLCTPTILERIEIFFTSLGVSPPLVTIKLNTLRRQVK
jgi:hypothetical protein